MRIGVVVLPDLPWTEARRRWLTVESLGFDHGWTYDHLAWRTLSDGPWYGAVPMLSAAAAVTSTLRLGTFVANPNFRHPVPFSKELMTLDDISDGRISLGVGAGGMGYDYTVLGGEPLTLGQRSARFREFVELLDQLLTQPVTSFEGNYYQSVDARMIPGCVQQPRIPFFIAANGPKMMRVAARFGQRWITTGDIDSDASVAEWWAGVATKSQRMDETLEEVGRSAEGFDKILHLDASGEYSLQSVGYFEDCVGKAAEAGFTDVVVHYPRPEGLYAGDESILESIAPG